MVEKNVLAYLSRATSKILDRPVSESHDYTYFMDENTHKKNGKRKHAHIRQEEER